jgi:hypothetical protein
VGSNGANAPTDRLRDQVFNSTQIGGSGDMPAERA